jgi:hypothetical protein
MRWLVLVCPLFPTSSFPTHPSLPPFPSPTYPFPLFPSLPHLPSFALSISLPPAPAPHTHTHTHKRTHTHTRTHTGLWGTSPSTSHGSTIGVNLATRNARIVRQDASGPTLPKIDEPTHTSNNMEDLVETVGAVGEVGGEGTMSVYSSRI